MIKQFIYVLLLISGINSQLQAQSFSSQVKYDKEMQPGLKLELPYSSSVAEGTILKKLDDIGYKPESTGELLWKRNTINGFYVFKGVPLPALNGTRVDLFFDVQSRKKNNSIMSLLVSKDGGGSFASADSDPAIFNAATVFLNGFVSETETFKYNIDVNKQAEAVKDAEKKLSNLKDSEVKLNKKIVDTQRDLEDNIKDQAKQVQEVDNQKMKLEELRKKQ